MNQRRNIAVVGAGVAGIVSAHILSRAHDVTIFESSSRIGGHTNTVELKDGPDAGAAIDTGFIVLNDKNYPLLHKFLKQLEVPVRWSNMSFGYHCDSSGFEYSGDNLYTLFCDRFNLLRPKFYLFIFELCRFCKRALSDLEAGELSDITLGEYLTRVGANELFVEHYLIPMAAAIWSAPDKSVLDFPAEMFVRFFKNHGLLSFADRPRWQTVVGGSHSYLKKFKSQFKGQIELNRPVVSVSSEGKQGVYIGFSDGSREQFDDVVVATHADQARSILSPEFGDLLAVLKDWSYHSNHTVLHTDETILPKNRRCWSSWNYRRVPKSEESPVFVSYYMNLLQGLDLQRDYIVTLNSSLPIDEKKIVAEFSYSHPVYSREVIDTASDLDGVNGEHNVYLCGSYTGNGFHEDAVRSAVKVASLFGLDL